MVFEPDYCKQYFTPIGKVYPELYQGSWRIASNYMPMIRSLDIHPIIDVTDNDYQGDTRLLFSYNSTCGTKAYGTLTIGWGSCSGCDALMGCSSYIELEELRRELWDQIHWEESATGMLHFFTFHDWEGDYHYRIRERMKFINTCIEYLLQEIILER